MSLTHVDEPIRMHLGEQCTYTSNSLISLHNLVLPHRHRGPTPPNAAPASLGGQSYYQSGPHNCRRFTGRTEL